jgi:hypothetical protein
MPNGSRHWLTVPCADCGARPGRRCVHDGLALNTPLPTPTFGTTIDQVIAGDRLLGPDGRPATVVSVSAIRHLPSHRIVFDDRTTIVAAEDHEWRARTADDDDGDVAVTTADLFAGSHRIWAPWSQRWRPLVALESVGTVAVRNVVVDSAGHQFLAGDGGHATCDAVRTPGHDGYGHPAELSDHQLDSLAKDNALRARTGLPYRLRENAGRVL